MQQQPRDLLVICFFLQESQLLLRPEPDFSKVSSQYGNRIMLKTNKADFNLETTDSNDYKK